MISGVLVIDKPAGPTSFDVVQRVRRLARVAKAGHAGTLDPAATGVLAVCLGDAVKLQQFLSDADKAYEATVAFGAATDTEDAEGRVIETADASALSAPAIAAALPAFLGAIAQVPPMYSAVRVGGRRLHEAARAGESVARTARTVHVHALSLLDVSPAPGGRMLARLFVRCGKGTYVRTLAVDLGRALGIPAHLAALRRTEASGFRVEDALPLAEVERLSGIAREELLGRIVPLAKALGVLPAVTLDWRSARDLAHGRPPLSGGAPPAPSAAPAPPADAPPLVRALAPDGTLVAVCEPVGGRLRPVRVFARPAELAAAEGPPDVQSR
jgi:tRNA pseudouridine55 synthase